MGRQGERGSVWPLHLLGALLSVAALLVVAWNVELPYLAFSAGPVSDAADSIEIGQAEVHPPQGELLMLTLVSQEVNVFEAVIAGFDPTIDLVRREAYRRADESDEDYRRRVLQQMDDSERRAITVALHYLGYEMIPAEVLVTDVIPDKPAAEVLQIGDTLLTLAGHRIASTEDLIAALEPFAPGDVVEMTIVRDGAEQTVSVPLAARDDAPDQAMIGIVAGQITIPPFPVEIDAGNVGGPSAGLMHALAIIDNLTPGELTKGHVIAGTGTIQWDGTVGNIGGVRQKVVAAEAAGAGYVLVPAGNYEEALSAAPRNVVLVPVATLEEAIRFLEDLPPA